MTGIGDRLICLAAAWLYARATGRTLIADWRSGFLAPNPNTNAFPLCFANRGDLAGVPFIGDDTVVQIGLPSPRFPWAWNIKPTKDWPFSRPVKLLDADRRAAVEIIRANQDRPEQVVIFDTCINDGIVRFEDAHEFFQTLQPVESVAAAVAKFRREGFGDRPVIGLHVRHGNGGDIMDHTRFWVSFEEAIARCRRCVALAREKLDQDAGVFLCTDSREVQDAVKASVPGVFTRPKQFRRPGTGELHGHGGAWRSREDTLTEMLLLSHMPVLIRYPPGSFFSLYAAVMKPRTQPAPPTLYDLLAGIDPSDPLSPALLF
jgi:hypothetical protein